MPAGGGWGWGSGRLQRTRAEVKDTCMKQVRRGLFRTNLRVLSLKMLKHSFSDVVSVHVLCICSGRERVAGPSCCILSKT
jgi:hypothetical protein